jgi:RNA polymerase sigma-70 factor, ECF subfamily
MLRIGKSEKIFQDAYHAHAGSIHRTLKGMVGSESVAEELTQEAFIKAWKGLSQFGFRSSLKTWLYQVAINVGRDWLRSHKNRWQSCEIDNEYPGQSEKTAEKKEVQEALLELEEEIRTILVLFYYEGMKQDEISRVLKIPEGTVKSRLHTAKIKLREKLLLKGFDV